MEGDIGLCFRQGPGKNSNEHLDGEEAVVQKKDLSGRPREKLSLFAGSVWGGAQITCFLPLCCSAGAREAGRDG